MKRIVLLGASGSIGRSSLKIIKTFPDKLSLIGISVHTNQPAAFQILREQPSCKWAVISGSKEQRIVHEKDKVIAYGRDYILEMVDSLSPDIVIFAMPGGEVIDIFLGLLERNLPIAMANKECLVMAGPLIQPAVNNGVLPIDSEQSALWQILPKENFLVERVILTCSGGPFWRKSRRELENVTVEEALRHPRWKMGQKVTLDSATLMNKALEMIESVVLFGIDKQQISTVIHPQSEVHSIVELIDGSLLIEASITDMRFAIQYALSFPERWANPNLRFNKLGNQQFAWEFFPPDEETFVSLKAAKLALDKWDSTLVVFNTSNDIVGRLFLEGKIKFLDIMDITLELVQCHKPWKIESYGDIVEAVTWSQKELYRLLR